MSKLIQKIAVVPTVVAGLIGAVPQTTKAEKKIEINYRIGENFSNIMNEQVARRIDKANVVVERYTPQYTGDAGAGDIIEDLIDIIVGGIPGNSRCVKHNLSGKVIGTSFTGTKVAPSRTAFEFVIADADTDKNRHVSIEEANDYRIRSIVRHIGSYPNCKD